MKAGIQLRIERLLEKFVSAGYERGVQVAAYFNGELVVDAWAGTADPAGKIRVDGQTLFPVFSTTKGIAATLVHQLVEQGKLEYDAPLARVWPEFAGNGKEKLSLRHALTHTAGLAAMAANGTFAELGDWAKMCRQLAERRPVPAPGEREEYHAITYGWLIGEPACRVTGRDFPSLLREMITGPLGVEDELFIGLPAKQEARVAWLENGAPPPAPGSEPAPVNPAIPPWTCPLEALMNDSAVRQACLPASSGIMTARAIARHYAALIGDGVDGVRLLSPAALRRATTLSRPAQEPEKARFGLGYGLSGPENDRGRSFGHGGYGGSAGSGDQAHRLAVGVTKNRLNTCPPGEEALAGQVMRELRLALNLND